MGNENKGDRR